MDKEFIVLMQKLVAEQEKEVLLNATKAKALLADYTQAIRLDPNNANAK